MFAEQRCFVLRLLEYDRSYSLPGRSRASSSSALDNLEVNKLLPP